MDGRWRADD